MGQMLIDEIREAHQSAGWSRKTLAERIGADPQAIKRLEMGVGSVQNLTAVMEALDFEIAGLGKGATLHDRLRGCRQRRSISIGELAARTGLSRNTIAGLEKGGGSAASLLRLLAVLAPKARRRAPERSYWGPGDKMDRDARFTPANFMSAIYDAFGEVDLDPCGHELSPVIAKRRILLSEGGDGLAEQWSGRLAYVNPPYSELLVWLRRAHDQWRQRNIETVVCLVPVRTDSSLFHHALSLDADIFLIRGRVRFLDARGRGRHTPFSLMLMTFGAVEAARTRFGQLMEGFWISRGLDRTTVEQVAGAQAGAIG